MAAKNGAAKVGQPLVMLTQSAICRSRIEGIHRPAPSLFYYPGLNTMPVFPENHFSFEKVLRDNVDEIKKEYLAIRRTDSSDYDMTNDHNKLHDGKWDWNSYVLKGKRSANFAAKCPKTVEILESLRLMVGTPFSYTFFSSLGPNSHIKSHFGPCNMRLRCHLPLFVPNGDCHLEVAGQKIKWEVGKPIVFDDCFQHQAWNYGDADRVVLLFDFWHPDLHNEEIEAIIEMFDDARLKGWIK